LILQSLAWYVLTIVRDWIQQNPAAFANDFEQMAGEQFISK